MALAGSDATHMAHHIWPVPGQDVLRNKPASPVAIPARANVAIWATAARRIGTATAFARHGLHQKYWNIHFFHNVEAQHINHKVVITKS